jgi:GTPase Era involved in 16S rRNA processing
MKVIPQMISQKIENKKTKLPLATFQLSIKVKEAFSEIMPHEQLLKINDINLCDYIHYYLYLPDQCFKEDLIQDLQHANANSKLRTAVC